MAADLDLDAYFHRVGYAGPTVPTLETLRGWVTAHTRRIPFENLDPLMGVPVDDLGATALMNKMVQRRRTPSPIGQPQRCAGPG